MVKSVVAMGQSGSRIATAARTHERKLGNAGSRQNLRQLERAECWHGHKQG